MANDSKSTHRLIGVGNLSGSTTSGKVRKQLINRRFFAPILFVTLGCLLYIYSNTTVAAAKAHAARSREADGGSINWRNENARRHGMIRKVEDPSLLEYMLARKPKQEEQGHTSSDQQRQELQKQHKNPIEEAIKQARKHKPPRDEGH